MRRALIVEGATEPAFKPALLDFLKHRLPDGMPRLDFVPEHGRIAKDARLKRQVAQLLRTNDAVIALTDVYSGGPRPEFRDAAEAKQKLRKWVGAEPRFHPHAALYDFEAWLLPYWQRIQTLAGSTRVCPAPNPETVNHGKPPAKHLAELFMTGTKRRSYSKVGDARAILAGQDLSVAAAQCMELRALPNTILHLAGGTRL